MNIEDKFGISIQVKKKELVKGKAEINELENKTALINEKPVFSFNNKTSSNFLPQPLAQACRFIWSHWGFAYVLLHPFLSHLEKSSFS